MSLIVSVSTAYPQDIHLIIRDSHQADTILTDRVLPINGDGYFFVRLPLCRKYVDIILYNDADGSDNGFTYVGCTKEPLEKRLDLVDIDNTFNLQEFIVFLQKFCYNAGILKTNNPNSSKSYYCSKAGFGEKPNFYIKYLPVIIDEYGEELTTPARISESGIIEVSQKYFIGYTVPGRVATLLHEYSHIFANENPDDESEADINGLIIYLGLGYPRVEAGEVWCQIFEGYDTPENTQRLNIMFDFIENFENNDTVFW